MTFPRDSASHAPDYASPDTSTLGLAVEQWWSTLSQPWSPGRGPFPWPVWSSSTTSAEPDLIGASGMIAAHHSSVHGARDYALFVPPEARVHALPVIMMLHGCKQDPVDFAQGTGMNVWAQRTPCIVIYPSQPQRENGLRCWNWFKPEHQHAGHGEPALLTGILRDVIAAYGADPRRVYVAGLSAGGAMAAILARAYPNLIAAVGVHSGLAAGLAHDLPSALALMRGGLPSPTSLVPARQGIAPSRTVPMIAFQGGSDKTVAALNAQRLMGSHLPQAQPARTLRTFTLSGRQVDQTVWHDASQAVVGEQWSVPQAGHAWFGGNADGSYTDVDGPDASGEMLRFFLAHPRRPRP